VQPIESPLEKEKNLYPYNRKYWEHQGDIYTTQSLSRVWVQDYKISKPKKLISINLVPLNQGFLALHTLSFGIKISNWTSDIYVFPLDHSKRT
jgi:hypothetical protein